MTLIQTRLGFINDNDNAARMEPVMAELDDTYFSWWGPQDVPGFACFRITAPSTIIEYSLQDTLAEDQGWEHAHSMYRDPGNDYGMKWIGAERCSRFFDSTRASLGSSVRQGPNGAGKPDECASSQRSASNTRSIARECGEWRQQECLECQFTSYRNRPQIQSYAPEILSQSVLSTAMPLGNETGMTE